MSKDYSELNPRAQSHQEFLDAIREELDAGTWTTTPELKDKLLDRDDVTWKKSYVRSMLTYARPYLKDNGDIEVDSDPRGGEETYLWRLA